MAPSTITVCKFVGTISLGLLTGQSLTLSTTLLPTLSTFPSSPSAQKTHSHLAAVTRRQTAFLSALSGAAFALAYALSPRRSKHPYLIYATLAVAGGWSGEVKEYVSYLLGGGKGKERVNSRDNFTPTSSPAVGQGDSSGDEEWDLGAASGVGGKSAGGASESVSLGVGASQSWNGEAVREKIERWRSLMGRKAIVWGLGWTMAVVGLWGDGAH